jgi:hypothetical protein
MWKAAFSSSTIDVKRHATTEVFVHHGMADELGTIELERKPKSPDADPRMQRLRYMSVFRQQPDGTWKFHRWLAQSGAVD